MNKHEALETALEKIEKDFGKGSVMKLGENAHLNVEAISTGALPIDVILGIGGIPRGRITEIYGPESSGKTTLALQVIAQAQQRNGIAAFVDAEHALDPEYAKSLGVDIDNLLISQPDFGEQALSITEALVRSGAIDIIVIDSVAALVPRSEIDGEMGDSHVGLQARMMSQALRKLSGAINKSKTAVIFINQLREKIGVMYGNPETTTGGRALKFYASVRIDIRKGALLEEGGTNVGNIVRVKIVKNKVAPPFKQTECEMIYGKGISRESSILDMAATAGIVKKSGTWYSYGDLKLGQGKAKVRSYFEQNKELTDEIEAKVYEHYDIAITSKDSLDVEFDNEKLNKPKKAKGSKR